MQGIKPATKIPTALYENLSSPPSLGASGFPPSQPSLRDISNARPLNVRGFELDGGLQRHKALTGYVQQCGESLMKHHARVEQTLAPGLLLGVVRVVECAEKGVDGTKSITVEGLNTPAEWILDVTDVPTMFSVYPGKVILVAGSAFGKDKFATKGIYDMPVPTVFRPPSARGSFQHRFIFTAGSIKSTGHIPFSIAQHLRSSGQETPDLRSTVVFLGPFCDSSLADLTKNTPLDVYQAIGDKCIECIEDNNCVIVGHVQDLIGHNVFPQPALRNMVSEDRPTLKLLPNPGTFEVNGCYRVGVCTADSPYTMSSSFVEGNLGAGAPPRVARIMNEIVRSGLFHPVLLPSEETPIDVSALAAQQFPEGMAPNLLVMSTRLQSQAGRLENGTFYLNINHRFGATTERHFFEVVVQGQEVTRVETYKI